MIQVSTQRPVLLVNSIGMRMPTPGKSSKFASKVFRKLKSMAKLLRRAQPDNPNLYVMSPIALPVFGVPGIRHLAIWSIRAQVAMAARWIGIKKPIVIVTPPTAWNVAKSMKRTSLIYNRSDKHSAFKEADTKMIRGLELELMAHADHVLYVSRELMAEDAPDCKDNAFFLDHGVKQDWFKARESGADEPACMKSIPHPRIGFFGGLRAHLVDLELLAKVADELPGCQLVLIGDTPSDISDLTNRTNVHWLGFKDHTEIPTLGTGFDVALMPYIPNDWIRHCNPIKLKEYLALGLCVVSTDFPEARRHQPHVHVAANADEFVELCRVWAARSIDGSDQTSAIGARQDAVRDATWQARAKTLLSLAEGETQDA